MDNWQSKYQNIYDSVGWDPQAAHVLVDSENGKEDPAFLNANNNGTVDVGLLQINVALPPGSTVDTQNKVVYNPDGTVNQQVAALQNPQTNIQQGYQMFQSRLKQLGGDTALALASWNKGVNGVLSDPQGAMDRIKTIYNDAQLPMPQTPFTQSQSVQVQGGKSIPQTPAPQVVSSDPNAGTHTFNSPMLTAQPKPTTAPKPPQQNPFQGVGQAIGGAVNNLNPFAQKGLVSPIPPTPKPQSSGNLVSPVPQFQQQPDFLTSLMKLFGGQ